MSVGLHPYKDTQKYLRMLDNSSSDIQIFLYNYIVPNNKQKKRKSKSDSTQSKRKNSTMPEQHTNSHPTRKRQARLDDNGEPAGVPVPKKMKSVEKNGPPKKKPTNLKTRPEKKDSSSVTTAPVKRTPTVETPASGTDTKPPEPAVVESEDHTHMILQPHQLMSNGFSARAGLYSHMYVVSYRFNQHARFCVSEHGVHAESRAVLYP